MSTILTPKPYNPLQRIRRAIFGGKPQLITDVDLNRQFEILLNSVNSLHALVGSSFNNAFTNNSYYDASNNNKLVADLSWTGFSIVCQGIEFAIPSGSYTDTSAEQDYPALRCYLIATKSLIDFATDPIMSGVASAALPASLPSASHEVFTTYRLAFSIYPTAPTLSVGEEVITTVATIIPLQKRDGTWEARLYKLTNSAYTQKVKSLLGDKFVGSSLIEINQLVLDYVLDYIREPLGTWKGFHGTTTGNFDGTGLGINKWIGWAFPNGQNGLDDWRGRSPIMFDDRVSDPSNGIWDADYNTIGNTLGNKSKVLTQANLPNIALATIPIGNAGNPDGSGDRGGNYLLNTAGGSNGSRTLSVSLGGSDLPFNLIQPSIVTGFVIRIS